MRHDIDQHANAELKEIVMSAQQTFNECQFRAEPLEAKLFLSARSARQSNDRAMKPSRKGSTAETKLIERLQAGDEQAFEAIFNKYSPKLYNIAQRILGEPDTQEVMQDVFLTVYRKAKTFQGDSQFSTWLYRLTVNAALGKIRKNKNRSKEVEYQEFLPKFGDDGHHAVRPVIDWSDTLDENYAQREVQQLLASALEQLKPLDRSVVVLSDLEPCPIRKSPRPST
jgi:RNA polymerase sigma-70 factor (ECF subfamily)